MTPILPIHVEALRVSPSTAQTVMDALYDFSVLGSHPISSQGGLIAAKNFEERFAKLPPGLHLHWSTPRAYTRGAQSNTDGALGFPTLPNRWLITRFLRSGSADPTLKMWLLESDAYGDIDGQQGLGGPVPIPVHDANEGLYGLGNTRMGRIIALDPSMSAPWTESTGAGSVQYLKSHLQAPFAYGETFAAYYRNSGGALGFYDSLDDTGIDLQSGSFAASYSVIGWVSDADHDVLNQLLAGYDAKTTPDYADFLKGVFATDLKWQFDTEPQIKPADAASAQGLLSGMVAGIGWNAAGASATDYPSALPSASQMTVGIGNNTAEAISAYMAGQEKSKMDHDPDRVVDNLEWLLNAFQYGQLQHLAAGSQGVGQLEEYLHTKSYAGRHGGYVWSVRPPSDTSNLAAPSAGAQANLPLVQAKVLSELNRAQEAHEATLDAIAAHQKKLFFDWSYHVDALYEHVIKPQDSSAFDKDTTGAYLLDGLLRLMPRFLQAGTRNEPRAARAYPYAYAPDSFAIEVPDAAVPEIAGYAFNAKPNTTAESAAQTLLELQHVLDAALPEGLASLQEGLETALLMLRGAGPGGSDAQHYIAQARTLLSTAQATAAQLHSGFGLPGDARSGLGALEAQAQGAAQALSKLWDGESRSGDFAGYFPIQNPGLSNTPYVGQLADRQHFLYARSWDPDGAFPGIKALLDHLTGQDGTDPALMDTSAAAIALATAYVWASSDEAYSANPVAYSIELAEAEIAQAGQAATTMAQDLKAAGTHYSGFASSLGAGLAALADTAQGGVLQNILDDLQAGQVATARTKLEAVLGTGQHGAVPQSLPDLAALLTGADWTEMVQALVAARQVLMARLPTAHQVHILAGFLYGEVKDTFELRQVPGDTFWQPSEPVIVLGEGRAGDRILRPVNRNGRAELLPCRVTSEIAADPSFDGYPDPITRIGQMIAPGNAALTAPIEALLKEAYLLAPEVFKGQITPRELADAATYNTLAQQSLIQTVPLTPATGDPQNPIPGTTGKLPYFTAYNFWQPSSGAIGSTPEYTDTFLPLFIYWEAEQLISDLYDPDNETVPANYLTQNFEMGAVGVDYQPASVSRFKKNLRQPNALDTRGIISLSSAATANLKDQIRSYCRQNLGGYDPKSRPAQGDDDYDEKLGFFEAYNGFEDWTVLSQGLSGFNLSGLQRVQELQIPINIPAAWRDLVPNGADSFWVTQFLHDQSQDWGVEWSAEGLNFAAFAADAGRAFFAPVRGGFLQIKQLHLVDAFGRSIAVPAPNPEFVAEAMQTRSGDVPDADHKVYLAPRLTQPSRLTFRWRSAEGPDGLGDFTAFNPHPAASPICGWLMPNHLDDSLLIYDAAGAPIGAAGRQDTNVHWFPVPGQTVTDIAALPNPVLRDFLGGFVNPGADFGPFQGFLDLLDQSQQFIISKQMQQDQALAVLLGRPLVLAQARLQLQMQGPADTSLDSNPNNPTLAPWDGGNSAFRVGSTGYVPYDFANFNAGDLGQLNVPITLGDPLLRTAGAAPLPYFDDGLVGFFVDGAPTFYTPLDLETAPAGVVSTFSLKPADQPVMLRPGGPPVTVTMILDPRAKVRATSGVLPVASAVIPPDQYGRALDNLMAFFLTAPLLTRGVGKTGKMPVPSADEKGFDWLWYQIGAPNTPVRAPQHNMDAVFPEAPPQHLVDGWMKLVRAKSSTDPAS